jgi:hypothetical protein
MVTKKKSPTLKLKALDYVSVESGAINVCSWNIEGEEYYTADVILRLDNDDTCIPIIMGTNIYSDTPFEAAFEAFELLVKLTESIRSDIPIINEEGDVVDEFTVDDVMRVMDEDGKYFKKDCGGDCDGCDGKGGE